jgi:hypothetical protein
MGVMAGWTPQDVATIGGAEEIRMTPVDADGTTRTATTIWVVRDGDGIYIRSYRGAAGAWYRAVRRSGRARIRAAGMEHDVMVTPHDGGRAELDNAYRTKYGRSVYVHAMVTDAAAATTLKLTRN